MESVIDIKWEPFLFDNKTLIYVVVLVLEDSTEKKILGNSWNLRTANTFQDKKENKNYKFSIEELSLEKIDVLRAAINAHKIKSTKEYKIESQKMLERVLRKIRRKNNKDRLGSWHPTIRSINERVEIAHGKALSKKPTFFREIAGLFLKER